MKLTIFSLFLLLSGTFSLMAEATYEVGASRTFKTISEAWADIKANGNQSDHTYRILVDEGTYIEGELKGIANVKIFITGAGADKTIIKRKDVASFELLDCQQCGFLFRSLKTDNPLANNMELMCEKMTFQYIGASISNAGGAFILAEAENQKYTFKNCNFKNIYARQGALITTTAAAATPVSFTMEDCFVENCGLYEYNNICGLLFFRWGGTINIKNTSFMNNFFEFHNQHPEIDTGIDKDRKQGLILHVIAVDDYPTNINFENLNIVHSSINAETTSLATMIRIIANSSASINELNMKKVVCIGNVRESTPDCDFVYWPDLTPASNSSVFNKVKMTSADGKTFDDVITLDGAIINTALTYSSPEVAFDMEGNLPKVYTNEFGAKYLKNNVISGNQTTYTNDFKISVLNGAINISNLTGKNKIFVYNMVGGLVRQLETDFESVNIPLNSGIYLLKIGQQVIKVIL